MEIVVPVCMDANIRSSRAVKTAVLIVPAKTACLMSVPHIPFSPTTLTVFLVVKYTLNSTVFTVKLAMCLHW